MKKVLFLFLIVFVIYGCGNKQNTVVQSGEEKAKVLVEESVVSKEELPLPSEEIKKEVVSDKMEVKAKVLAETDETFISEDAKKIILENSWGGSIYDPETGIIEYYTSKGGFLGRMVKQAE